MHMGLVLSFLPLLAATYSSLQALVSQCSCKTKKNKQACDIRLKTHYFENLFQAGLAREMHKGTVNLQYFGKRHWLESSTVSKCIFNLQS